MSKELSIRSWKCRYCGKVLHSLSEKQLEEWKKIHLLSHSLKRKYAKARG